MTSDAERTTHESRQTVPSVRSRKILEKKIRDRSAEIGVIGLGYVGLSLAVEFGKAGFVVRGVDVDPRRVAAITAGSSYIVDVSDADLQMLTKKERLVVSLDPASLATVDVLIICVPTPLRKTREPDISYIVSAVESIIPLLHRSQLLILESTTYPGTTEEVVLPKIESTGLSVGTEIFLAFSPERVDPGNPKFHTRDIPKIVGGVTSACTAVASLLYEQVICQVIPVSNPRVAETTKLLENTFRSVNIALANEMALICRHLGINTWEVIQAAASKPFGFMPFYPGPGIGGHCIPIDPFYLSWKVRVKGYEPKFISLADEINRGMPHEVVTLVADGLNDQGKCLRGARILLLGVAYKQGVADVRESPALAIMSALEQKGASVLYTDPYVPLLEWEGRQQKSVALSDDVLQGIDCAVIVTDHPEFEYHRIVASVPVVVDTRNATHRAGIVSAKVINL